MKLNFTKVIVKTNSPLLLSDTALTLGIVADMLSNLFAAWDWFSFSKYRSIHRACPELFADADLSVQW